LKSLASFVAVWGGRKGDGVFAAVPGLRLSQIPDGAAYTLMAGERPPPDNWQAGTWYSRVILPGVYGPFVGPDNVLAVESGIFPGDDCAGPMRFGPGRTGNPCDRYHFWSLHRGGANFVFADASVKFLPYSTSPIMIALATRAGGEAVELPE
jgi:prepilin-type processing-associated H-X9-DG protein